MGQSVGNALRVAGWVVIAYTALRSGWGVYETARDPSAGAHLGLIIGMGVPYLLGGGGLIWAGSRMRRSRPPSE